MIIYDPKTAAPWRKAVAESVGEVISAPLEGPIQLTLCFFFPRPKSHYGTGKNSGLIKKSAPQYHLQKPDADNTLKAVMDSLNGVAYLDDKQVTRVLVEKRWAHQPEQAGLALCIEAHEEPPSDQQRQDQRSIYEDCS